MSNTRKLEEDIRYWDGQIRSINNKITSLNNELREAMRKRELRQGELKRAMDEEARQAKKAA